MEKRVKLRSFFIGSVFALFFFALLFRVYWVQAIEAPVLLDRAKVMWEESKELAPTRGVIYDRNRKVLAQEGPAYTVAVNPRLIHEANAVQQVIHALAPILNMDDRDGRLKLEKILNAKNDQGQYVIHREIRNEGWKIGMDVAEAIRRVTKERQLPGIYLIEEAKRYYPANELAAQVIGYQDKEGKAAMGLEAYYDELLSGEPGYIQYETDLLGYETPDSKVHYEPAIDGHSIRLTIDENIQLYMEQALEEMFNRYHPKSASAIAVNPMTMEVLGMASLPSFDPNEYWVFDNYQQFTNHNIGSQYEPGSTFKIVTLAAAVEEGLFQPEETFMSGSIQVPGAVIRDHNYGRGWGEITYLDGLKLSSNVAFVKLGYEKLGAETLKSYIEKFGFGEMTGIDLPGEVRGRIDLRRPVEFATATFGQGITVTPIQEIAAISAIANGGKLMKPYIVKEVIDTETGETIEYRQPQVVREVLRESSAKQIGEYLELVISDQEIGTGRLAYLQDYPIAGKTGTAQKVIDGKYADDKWVLSFIGYAPVHDPKLALIVTIDEPEMGGDYRNAGPIIATVFKEIMSKSLRYLGVASIRDEMEGHVPNTVIVPNVEGASFLGAENELSRHHLQGELIGSGGRVVKQYPPPETSTRVGDKVYLLTESPDQVHLPNLTGKSLRDALQICTLLEIDCETSGTGYVIEQSVKHMNGNRSLSLVLQPPNVEVESSLDETDDETGDESNDEVDHTEDSDDSDDE